MELTFVGGLGGCLGRTIIEIYFSNFTKVPVGGEILMPGSNINAMNIDSRGPGKSGSSAGSNSVTGTSSSISPEIAEKAVKNVQSITKTFIDANQKSVDMLIMINNESHKFTLDQPQPF